MAGALDGDLTVVYALFCGILLETLFYGYVAIYCLFAVGFLLVCVEDFALYLW